MPQVSVDARAPITGPQTTASITPAATPYIEGDTTPRSTRTPPSAAQAIHVHINAREGVIEAIPPISTCSMPRMSQASDGVYGLGDLAFRSRNMRRSLGQYASSVTANNAIATQNAALGPPKYAQAIRPRPTGVSAIRNRQCFCSCFISNHRFSMQQGYGGQR
jgi:hypothetical protein